MTPAECAALLRPMRASASPRCHDRWEPATITHLLVDYRGATVRAVQRGDGRGYRFEVHMPAETLHGVHMAQIAALHDALRIAEMASDIRQATEDRLRARVAKLEDLLAEAVP